jgi:hypothetical protein
VQQATTLMALPQRLLGVVWVAALTTVLLRAAAITPMCQVATAVTAAHGRCDQLVVNPAATAEPAGGFGGYVGGGL